MGHSILRYWGKTGTESDDSPTYHPLAYHCLDVTACGRALLAVNPLLHRRLAKAAGLDESSLLGWASFLLSVHDLGKMADSFQQLEPRWMEHLQGRVTKQPRLERHDTLGWLLWHRHLGLLEDAEIREALVPQGLCAYDARSFVEPWLRAAAGHHGRPPRALGPGPSATTLKRHFPPTVVKDARAFILRSARKFLTPGVPWACQGGDEGELSDEWVDSRAAQFQNSSWLFAGFVVVADWLGSNTRWFHYETKPLEIDEYWSTFAVPRAERAISESGLSQPRAPARAGFQVLYEDFQPTELQQLAAKIPLAEGPQIFVIEEATGGGKTEAALTLAQRLIAAGEAQGVFLGLPTMATANAMFDRVERVHRLLFDQDGPEASLVLTHSKRHLRLALPESPPDEPYAEGGTAEETLTASLACTQWLADGRKRALLASVGVGTIDQALLAVLPVRHQSVRVWGLAGKVLIVDEVHACDSYMQALLRTLLTFHAAFGGSAILLSATLPKKQRWQLVRAFQQGRGDTGPELEKDDYPLLTRVAGEEVDEIDDLAARPEACREVEVEFLHSQDEVDELLLQAAREGRCACWIRNTVDDARESAERLGAQLGDKVTLFHSRFTVADRNRIEGDVLESFGKASGPEERAGRVVVATQVVEQSLDVDFDVMVIDLCPVDLVLQRLGRLMRHRRRADGTPLRKKDAPDLRGPAVLHILAPPFPEAPGEEPSEHWYKGMFERGAFVYPDHGRLWLGARVLRELGTLRIPEGCRALIDAVYGDEADGDIPESLQRPSNRAEGERHAAKALASFNALRPEKGYEATAFDWPEDVYTPTRLGEPTVTLRLARRVEGRVVPFEAGEDFPWERSEVSIPEYKVAREAEDLREETEAVREVMGTAGKWTLPLVMEEDEDGGWVGRAEDGKARPVVCRYDRASGFVVE